MSTTIAEYSATDSALAELRHKYADAVFDVKTGKGMTAAKEARAELREHRVALEKERVRIKAPALERCRQIDSEAKRITAELEALECPIDDQIKAEEHRKATEKAAKEEAERQRIAAINARFDAMKALPLRAVDASIEQIDAAIAEAEAIDPATFPEDMQDAARYEKQKVVVALQDAREKRVAAVAEALRIAEERAELDRLRREAAERQAELDRLAAEQRDREAAEARRLEEAARAEREAADRAAREAREAEQRRIDEERAEQRRREDAERAEQQRKDAEERARLQAERERLEAERVEAAKREREQAIANATLLSAAIEAHAFLVAEGYSDYLETQKLAAAIHREPNEQKEAA